MRARDSSRNFNGMHAEPQRTSTAPSFGEYLEQLIRDAGYANPADLARATPNLVSSTLYRWMRGEIEPTVSGLRSVAPLLHIRLGDLMVAAGLATPDELCEPIPEPVREVLARLRISTPVQAQTLLNAILSTLAIFDEIVDAMASPPHESAAPAAPAVATHRARSPRKVGA